MDQIASTFCVLIGSKGRDSLRFTLDSIARQARRSGDLCVVGLDAFEKTDDEIAAFRALVASYGTGFLSTALDAGYHWLGVEQINYAIRAKLHLRCSHVLTLGDDDVFTDDAFERLRPWTDRLAMTPILFRFLSPWRSVLWDVPRSLRQNHISGCCIAAPACFVDEMTTKRIVTHDFEWIRDIVGRASRVPIWLDELLVVARPDPNGDGDVRHGRFYRVNGGSFIQADAIADGIGG